MKPLQLHLLWLLPLLCGTAGYVVKHREVLAAKPDAALSVISQSRRTSATEPEIPAGESDALAPRLTGMDSAALRNLLLDLKAAQPVGWREQNRVSEAIDELVKKLGQSDQAENFKWLDGHCPESCRDMMEEWAIRDPEAALQGLIQSSTRCGGCSPETLYLLLQHQAEAGGPALTQAVAQIPWPLLSRGVRSSWPGGVDFPDDCDLKPWLDSGVVRTLAEKGVPMNGLMRCWFTRDREAALAAWIQWPAADRAGITQGLDEMICRCDEAPERAAFLDAAVAHADPATAERLREAYARIPVSKYDSGTQGIAHQMLPHLAPPDDEEETSDDDSSTR